MAYPAYAPEIIAAEAPAESRITFLRKVAGLTFVGLGISTITSIISAGVIYTLMVATGGFSSMMTMVLVLGSFGIAQVGGGSMVRSENPTMKYVGFFTGSVFQGIAMGFLVLSATLMSLALWGNPFALVFQALALVGLTTVGLTVYLLSGPKNLSMVRAGLSALFLPMMILMVVSFVYPVNGVLGLLMSILFVVVSLGGLLYQLNSVMHKMSTQMHVEGAFQIMMGILILFWNVLVLLMRLQGRD